MTNPSESTTQTETIDSLKNLRQRPAWRAATSLLGVAALALSCYYIVEKVSNSFSSIRTFDPNKICTLPIILSFVITLICVFLAIIGWHLTLKGLGASIGLRACAPPYLIAAISRYLPGHIWRHVGIAFLTKKEGVNIRCTSVAMLWEFLGITAIRSAIAVTTISPNLLTDFLGTYLVSYLSWLRVGIWIPIFSLPIILERVANRQSSSFSFLENSINKRALWLALGVDLLANLLYGLGFALLIKSMYEINFRQFVAAIFSTSISWVLSLLFLVPDGLGVRESIIIYTLGNVLPESIAVMGAIISRVILILAEICGALLGLWMSHRR